MNSCNSAKYPLNLACTSLDYSMNKNETNEVNAMETIIEQMTLGLQKLFAVVDLMSYSMLEELRREVLSLLGKIENRQDKLRLEALTSKGK